MDWWLNVIGVLFIIFLHFFRFVFFFLFRGCCFLIYFYFEGDVIENFSFPFYFLGLLFYFHHTHQWKKTIDIILWQKFIFPLSHVSSLVPENFTGTTSISYGIYNGKYLIPLKLFIWKFSVLFVSFAIHVFMILRPGYFFFILVNECGLGSKVCMNIKIFGKTWWK